jgi:phenylacetate-CoA ligase
MKRNYTNIVMIKKYVRLIIIDLLAKSSILKYTISLSHLESLRNEEIAYYQNKKLNELFDIVFEHSPYYKRLLKQINKTREDFRCVDDLKYIPIISREEIRENLQELRLKDSFKKGAIKRRTGGTTGVPLEYYSTKDAWSLGWALKLRDWSYGGYRIGNKMGLLGGSSLIPDAAFNIKRFVWNWVFGFHSFAVVGYNETTFKNICAEIRRKKIRFLRGYPTTIFSFSEYVERKGESIQLDCVFTTAEVLQSFHRDKIQRVFDCPVLDQYGCADGGGHASQTSKDSGYRLSFETGITELIPRSFDGNGAALYDLVFTSFDNYSMPLLRYSPGDLAELCDGVDINKDKVLYLKRIVGRTTEILTFSNGISLAGPAFTLFFRKFKLKQYQLVQETPNSLRVYLILDEGFDKKNDSLKILSLLEHHVGKDVEINIDYVNNIKQSSSGKHKFIVGLK